jgi:hypothetical protein
VSIFDRRLPSQRSPSLLTGLLFTAIYGGLIYNLKENRYRLKFNSNDVLQGMLALHIYTRDPRLAFIGVFGVWLGYGF